MRKSSFFLSGSRPLVMEEDCDGMCWKYLIEEEKLVPGWTPTGIAVFSFTGGELGVPSGVYVVYPDVFHIVILLVVNRGVDICYL